MGAMALSCDSVVQAASNMVPAIRHGIRFMTPRWGAALNIEPPGGVTSLWNSPNTPANPPIRCSVPTFLGGIGLRKIWTA